MKTFLVKRGEFQTTQFDQSDFPQNYAIKEDEVLLKIDSFAFTANNITYAMIGDDFGYWKFFPAQDGWGIIPVWGFAEVVASAQSEIQVGDRVYGYFPMADYLLVKAGKVNPYGFVDVSEHRTPLPPIYNHYTLSKRDKLYTPETEALQSIFRPLFTTSFLIDDFLADNEFFGAQNIILTSASSKTAIALAFLLAERKKSQSLDYQIIGLTSESNFDFVSSLKIYDQTLDYQAITSLNPEESYVIVDFAGNQKLQVQIEKQVQDNLKYICSVGLVHWDQRRSEEKPNKKGNLFFAPAQAQKRSQEWGAAQLQGKIASAWLAFAQYAQTWLEIEVMRDEKAIQENYLQALSGKTSPRKGFIYQI
jgi:hypothetical protein